MAEVMVTKDRLDYTIDVLAAMTIEELSEETGKDPKELIADFLLSKTGKALYDSSTKMWCNGPSYLADMYKEEVVLNHKASSVT